MGRRKDNPLEQAAKGFPGRRKGKVDKEIEAVVTSVDDDAVRSGDPFPLPALFRKQPAYWKHAIGLWRELSVVLAATGRRKPAYRAALTRYCIWTQLYMTTAEQLRRDLPRGGTTVKVKKGDGNEVYRTHPGLEFMAKAETQLRLLDSEFGLTPMRDQDLMKLETFNAGQGRLPFDQPPGGGRERGDDAADPDPMGIMNDDGRLPPGIKPN